MRHREPPTSHNNDNYIYVVHNIEKDGLQGFFLHASEPTEPTNTLKGVRNRAPGFWTYMKDLLFESLLEEMV